MEYKDKALCEVAQMLWLDKENPTFRRDLLDPQKLDFSLQSLRHLDEYLLKIGKDANVEKDWNRTVLRAGAYVGEVIKRASPPDRYHWLDYETAASLDKIVRSFGYLLTTCAILFSPPNHFVFPLGKVHKCLENGEEDNTHFFAQVIIADVERKL
jgi:hypothetical protein